MGKYGWRHQQGNRGTGCQVPDRGLEYTEMRIFYSADPKLFNKSTKFSGG
jgi:hypothetical protein